MDRKYAYLALASGIVFAGVVGAGLHVQQKRQHQTAPPPVQGGLPEGPQPYLPPEPDPNAAAEEDPRVALEAAVRRFRTASSYRAAITRNVQGGTISATLEYVRPFRLRAMITMPDASRMDTVAIGETTYVRTGPDAWEMVAPSHPAKQLTQSVLTSMSTMDETLASFGVDAGERIRTKENRKEACVEYATLASAPDASAASADSVPAKREIVFCVTPGRDIAFIRSQEPEGDTRTSYKDYNSLIVIERPPMPLLKLEEVRATEE